ncbi:helix-turn-helix transcriptional regulator (plasmid) [Paenibacillus thiaminolyticus]|uniref:helix-turn-helix transcriptional regulator n=1 Tax=Paenibacillus thiaminolyticus TaxID=49283 RepID=UPI00232F55DE|nr:helix-turn-helix transcriptional regulator [Paenibacillus thiaminolyticus]WCF11759.1 helix-turn-helix transcriptional regulator [Paenibacillus thiaminolyticus]
MEKINNLAELKERGLYIIEDDESMVENYLLQVLKDKGLNPSDLAKLTGISRQNINAIIHNKMRPGIDFVLKISYVLGEPIESLFKLTENAWVIPYKGEKDSSVYIDVFRLEIVDNSEKREQIKKTGEEYFDRETNQTYTKEEYASMQKLHIEKHLAKREESLSTKHPKLSKTIINSYAIDELKKEFNSRYSKIYKKLGYRFQPIVIPKNP